MCTQSSTHSDQANGAWPLSSALEINIMIKTKQYSPTKQVYRKLVRKEFIRNSKVIIALTIMFLIAITGISSYGFFHLGNNKILEAWTPLLIIVVMFWLYMLFYYPYATSNSKMNNLAFIKWQYTFNNNEFSAESEQDHKIYSNYLSLPKISIEKEYLMLYFSSVFVLLVPKEAFENESDFEKVINNF